MSSDLTAQYQMWLRSWSSSERTIKARTGLARSRLAEWGLDGMTTANIQAFLARAELRSGWSRTTYYSNLNDFCTWLVAAGHLPANPMTDVRKSRPPKSRPRPLSETEVARVLDVASGETRHWIVLALLAGLRVSEIAAVRGEDVTADGIHVRGKGDVTETLPCHPDLWEIAQEYPRHGYWWPGTENGHIRSQAISLTVGRLFHALGITGSIHRCRHTYGTRLLRRGVHIRTVQRLMRHASLSTTATYTAVDEVELRDAILKLTA